MSYGHGSDGPIRDVVEVLGPWEYRRCIYRRRVRLSCGHIICQTGGHKSNKRDQDGYYCSSDIRNLRTHKTAHCHICETQKK